VLAFDGFFGLCTSLANTDPNLRKELGSSGSRLFVSGINSSFFRNLFKNLTPGLPGSPNFLEDIAS